MCVVRDGIVEGDPGTGRMGCGSSAAAKAAAPTPRPDPIVVEEVTPACATALGPRGAVFFSLCSPG